jgi:hypothetical protein
VNDLAQACSRDPQLQSKFVYAQIQGFQKILVQGFSGMREWDSTRFPSGHRFSLVIIGNLDVEGVAVLPSKTDPIMRVDSHSVLTRSIALQGFQPVGGWRCEIPKFLRIIDLDQSPQSHRSDPLKSHDPLLSEDRFRILGINDRIKRPS